MKFEVFILGGQRIDQKRSKGWWRGSRERIEMEAQKVTELQLKRRIRNIYTCLCLFPQGAFLLSSRLDSAVKRCSSEVLMRLSILCPTTPPTGLGGARWGFVILASTKAPPLGATLADKSPLIPCIGGGAAVGKWGMEKNMVQYETLLLRNSRSLPPYSCIIQTPHPWGQRSRAKAVQIPTYPHPFPVGGVVGLNIDRRIKT